MRYYDFSGHAIRIAAGITLLALLLAAGAGVETITGENFPPVADAGPDQTVLFGEAVIMDGSGSYDPDGTIVSYEWDFGDPFNTTNGSGINSSHIYSHADVYIVTLTVTDDSGQKSRDNMTAVIEDKIIMLELNYSKDKPLQLIDKYRKNGFAPDRIIQPQGGYRAVVSNEAQRPLYSFMFDLPNMLQFDSPEGSTLTGGVIELNETNFTLNIPYFNNAAWVDIFNPDGIHALSINVLDIPDKGGSNCRTLINNGLSSSLFDITFVGDNYTIAQLPQFMSDVNRHQNTLLSVSPFASMSNMININWVNESRNLGCQYNYNGNPRLIGCNIIDVMVTASQCPSDEIIVLLNSNTYGGGGFRGAGGINTYMVAYSGNDTSLTANDTGDRVTVHEFGHSFGNLEDEYLASQFPSPPNLTPGPNCDNNNTCPKFAGISGNCIQNCSYPNWYRGDDSGGDLMLTLSNLSFGPVCSNIINTSLNQYPRTVCGGLTPCQCGDLLAQDRTMIQGQDFNQSGACQNNGLEIGASGINLDCSGVSITGNANPGFSGILNIIFDNVTVRNCRISNFSNGIHTLFVSNNSIYNNTVSSSMLLSGSNGIWVETSSITNISYNTVSSYDWGILLDMSSNSNLIEENNALSNLKGIYLYNSSNNLIKNNSVLNNTDGIYDKFGSFNTMTENRILYNIVNGTTFQFSNNDTLESNNISSNFVGIMLDFSLNNRIYNNYFNNAVNTVFSNVFNNIWNTTGTFRTNIVGGPFIGGNYWADPFGTGFSQTCQDIDKDGFCDSNITIFPGNIDYLPLSLNFTTVCSSGCDYTSIQGAINGSPNGSTISILAGNYIENVDIYKLVNLTGAGQSNSIISPASTNDHILNITAGNVTIKGFTVNGSTLSGYAGIFADNINRTNISNNNISGNIGIYLNYSSKTDIFNNTIKDNYFGIYIHHSSENVLEKNTVNTNGFKGIDIEVSNNNSIKDNLISNNDYGIVFSIFSTNNILTNNTFTQNNIHDVRISEECNNILTNNTGSGNLPIKYFNSSINIQNETLSELILCNAYGSQVSNLTLSGSGLLVSMTDNAIFTDLNSSDNYFGIYLWESDNITIENSSMNSDIIGIQVYGVNNSNISNNTLRNNVHGIWIPSSGGNTFKNNTITGNDFGMSFVNSDSNTINNNNLSSSSDTGIQIESSKYNILTNNILVDNSDGIRLTYSSRNNSISGNIITASGSFALYVDNSDNNTLFNNIIQNGYFGIRMNNSSLGKINDNLILNNSLGIELTGTNAMTANQNVVCANSICDFNLTNAQNNAGINNTCDSPDGWNDSGTNGCSLGCASAFVNTSTGMGRAYFKSGAGIIQNITAINASSLPQAPNVSFPYGLFSFNITGLSPGQNVTVSIIYPGNVPVTSSYWKYGPTPDNTTLHWYQIPQGSNDGDNIITINLTDGGQGDDDRNANGIIEDDGGTGIFVPDTTPPASVSNIHNVSYAPDYINWTWIDPQDEDFFKVIVYLDGVYMGDVMKGEQFYNASVSPGTYTIGTRTVDVNGNANATLVTHNATTMLPAVRYINGTVREKNDPLSMIMNATVSTDTGISAMTNEIGFYSLSVTSGIFNITASFEPTHYENNSITVSTEFSAVVLQDIELSKKPTGDILGSVTIV